MDWQELSTREWAAVFWIAVLAVIGLVTPSIRRGFAPVARTFLVFWQFHITLALFFGWIALICYLARFVGAWNEGLLKDTVAWVVFYGFALILSADRAAKDERFFRRSALTALSIGALMQFVLNLHTFHIAVELFLLPVVTFLYMLEAVAGMDAKTRSAQNLFNLLILAVSLWVIIATARGLLDSWRGLDLEQTGLAFAFSIWFPLAMLPFVFVFSLVLTYGASLSRACFHNDDKPPSLGARSALLVGLHGNLRAVNDLSKHHAEYRAIVRSRSFREGLRNVRIYVAAREAAREEKEEAAARLIRYAGVKGLDDDGKVLDQREIKETRDALRWIETCHRGRYNTGGKFRKDLLSGVLLDNFNRQGLPKEHGIRMCVRKDGQAWYAWRRTPSGRVLGIGMANGRDNEWLYEGEEPPKGFPASHPSWGDRPYETPPNWQ